MGAGKSYIGKRLAERMQVPFCDLDRLIEKKEGQTIPQIFENRGEAHFRELEKQYLHSFEKAEQQIVATGGGTPCFFDNMEYMKQRGVTIYLKASPALLTQRLLHEKSHRPLIASLSESEVLDFIKRKLSERSMYYEQAAVIAELKSDGLEILDELFTNFNRITGH